MFTTLLACKDTVTDSAEPETVEVPAWCSDSPQVTWSNFGEGFLLTHCQGCHAEDAPNRFGAPESVYFDTEADVDAQRASIYRVVLTDQSMPPAGGITDDELALAEIWLECDL